MSMYVPWFGVRREEIWVSKYNCVTEETCVVVGSDEVLLHDIFLDIRVILN